MIDDKWYHFDARGYMQTGWIYLGNTWYYLESSGAMLCNQWGYINGKWYHFDGSGAMQTGWILLDGTWYYLESSGAMLSNQWGYINGEWYYFRASGAMASNTWVGIYYVDSNGRYIAQNNEKKAKSYIGLCLLLCYNTTDYNLMN